jgi:hypothetical protein
MRLHLLKYTRGATLRVPTLRERAASWWDKERREGSWVRGDERVSRVAERLGLGFDETGVPEGHGNMRAAARIGVQTLMTGFVPSQYWNVSE